VNHCNRTLLYLMLMYRLLAVHSSYNHSYSALCSNIAAVQDAVTSLQTEYHPGQLTKTTSQTVTRRGRTRESARGRQPREADEDEESSLSFRVFPLPESLI
jgi:hypothetical protein